jgi:hypothetical protein
MTNIEFDYGKSKRECMTIEKFSKSAPALHSVDLLEIAVFLYYDFKV